MNLTPSNFFRRILRSEALVYKSYFFSEQRFYGNYSTLDSHTITVIFHAFAYSSRWRRKPCQGLLYTAISRKVVGKMWRRQSRKIMCDTINHCSLHCSCRTYFCYFPFALANICPWPLVPFSQISLKNSELKTGQNSFRDCRLHFF